MHRSSVMHDIKKDLDGMPREFVSDLKQLVDDAAPAIGSTMQDARSRGAAVGSTLVGHLPDQVIDRVPDTISDRLPGRSSGMSTTRKLLLIGGIGAVVAAGFAAWKRWSSAPPAFTSVPNRSTHSANGHRAGGPTSLDEEAIDLPTNRQP